MDRRKFLAVAGAAVVAPMVPMAAPVTETYVNCPEGFALRSWSEGGRTYNAVVPVRRYGDEGGCRWVKDTFERSAFLCNIRWQHQIIGLAEIISGRTWNPDTHLYGQAWPEGSPCLAQKEQG